MAQATPDDNMTITPAEDTISAPYFDDAFTRSDTSIGSGSFGSVYECTPTPVGEAYLLRKGLIEAGQTIPGLVVKSLATAIGSDPREKENLSMWKHKGIVQFFGEFPDRSGQRHLVLEAMYGVGDGDLFKNAPDQLKGASPGDFWRYIITHNPISDGEFRMIAYQLLSAVAFLHSEIVAHRDLKTENMLCGLPILETKLGTAPTVKLSDFGTARALDVEDQFGLRRQGTTLAIGIDGTKRWTGTAQYIAPELLKLGEQADAIANTLLHEKAKQGYKELAREIRFIDEYDTKCDIYSLGVTFVFMLTKTLPYGSFSNPMEICFQYKIGETAVKKCLPLMNYFKIEPDTMKLVLSMIAENPDDRPSAETLLSKSYFDAMREDHGHGDDEMEM